MKLGAAAGSCMLGLLPTKGRVQQYELGRYLIITPTKGRVQQYEAVRVQRGVRALLRYEWPARPVGELHALVERRAQHLLTQHRQS